MKHRFIVMAIMGQFLTLLMGPVFAQPPAIRFTVTDLGTLPGGHESAAYSLNDRGQVVGWSDGGPDSDSRFGDEMIHNHAVLWDHGKMRDLGLLKGFPFSAGHGINRSGQIVGGWDLNYRPGNVGGPAGLRQTFLWQDGQMTILGNGPPSHLDYARAINDHGQVAGTAISDAGSRAVLWTKTKTTLLPLPVGFTESRAYALNNAGQVTGSATRAYGDGLEYHAFLWRTGKAVDLGSLSTGNGGHSSDAFGINDAGQMVGSSNGQAFLWQNGKMRDLGYLKASYPLSAAYGINNHGQIVGEADNDSPYNHHAFLWQNGTMYELSSLIPDNAGWTLEDARAINDQGQIVGWGQQGGKKRAFLLTPIKATH